MASLTTYNNCKTLYTLRRNNGELTAEFVEKQSDILDLFLMAGRITKEQYEELLGILTGKEESSEGLKDTEEQPEEPTEDLETPIEEPSESEEQIIP